MDTAPCLHPANMSMSATPTLYFTAKALSLLTVAVMGTLSFLASSIGLAREPSQPPCGKQSWKTARIDARASSVHCPPETNIPVSSREIVVQTAGHFPALLSASALAADASAPVVFVARNDNDGKVIACTEVAAMARRVSEFEKCIAKVVAD